MVKNRRILYKCRYCREQFSPGNLILDDPDDARILRDAPEIKHHHCDGSSGPRIGIADKIGMRVEEI